MPWGGRVPLARRYPVSDAFVCFLASQTRVFSSPQYEIRVWLRGKRGRPCGPACYFSYRVFLASSYDDYDFLALRGERKIRWGKKTCGGGGGEVLAAACGVLLFILAMTRRREREGGKNTSVAFLLMCVSGIRMGMEEAPCLLLGCRCCC